ncbi:chorismate mutase [Celeribacter persicus]|jgi:Chorismate mutase|uniref:chorismate mutase n=1 Tax=Celeribacter persicus TaxID=1651082 RepID=A0A2T5HW34_9RHOB|nr:chorismate mutase [Celeribacter persicus]PTQ75784.1 chorismate mutase [Celeribacter persicus]
MTLKSPKDIDTMAELRDQIDRLDRELVDLLAVRQAHIDRAAEIKPGEGLPARIETRVHDVLDKVETRARQSGFDPVLARQMWALMIEDMIAREERVLGRDR